MPPGEEEPNEEQGQEQEQEQLAVSVSVLLVESATTSPLNLVQTTTRPPTLPALLKVSSPPTRGRPPCQPMTLYASRQ